MEDVNAVIFHSSKITFLFKKLVQRLQLALRRNLTLLAEVISFLSIELLLCCLNASVQCISQFCAGKITCPSWRRVSCIMSKSQTISCYSLNLDSVENLVINSAGLHWIITLTVVASRCSNAGSGCLANGVLGHCLWCWLSHSGPSHHNLLCFKVSGVVPRDMRSAGLLADATCLHSHPAVNSCIWETLLADVANHESTILESVRNKIPSIFKFNAGTVFCNNCAKSKAPHNSNLGSVIFLTGATLD
jgi:hypothetical protein